MLKMYHYSRKYYITKEEALKFVEMVKECFGIDTENESDLHLYLDGSNRVFEISGVTFDLPEAEETGYDIINKINETTKKTGTLGLRIQ